MASISPVAAVRTSSAATRRDSCGCVIVPGSTPRAARCGARSPGVRGRAARTAGDRPTHYAAPARSEEHTSELQSRLHLVCRLLLEKKKTTQQHVVGACYFSIEHHVDRLRHHPHSQALVYAKFTIVVFNLHERNVRRLSVCITMTRS